MDILRLEFIPKLLDEDGLNIAGNVMFIIFLKTTLDLVFLLSIIQCQVKVLCYKEILKSLFDNFLMADLSLDR